MVPSALRILRMGRVTALRKPDGGVRGIVVSDVLRQLVARTMAKQRSKSALKPRRPHSSTHCRRVHWKRMRLARAPDIDRSRPQRDNSVRGTGLERSI